MSSKIALSTDSACKMGSTTVQIIAMTDEKCPSVALVFRSERATGLSASFHGDADEMRHFASEIMRHAAAAEREIYP